MRVMSLTERSCTNPLQPLLTDIVAFTLRAENQGGCDGSYLRLVNHQFNDEVLRIWFITQQADPPRRNEKILQYDCLLSRRYLQGFLLRHASESLKCSNISISLTEAITRLRSVVPSKRLPLNSIDDVLGDEWQCFLCAAFTSLYHIPILMANTHKQSLTSKIVDQGQEAWFLTAACKLGDLNLIRSSFAEFDSRPLTAEAKGSFLLSCLCAAIREDWQQAFNFLLELELDINLNADDPTTRRPPIRIAAERGRITYLKTLFHPSNRLWTSGLSYERAIASAANYPDQSVRRELVDLFIQKKEGLLSREMRKEVLWGACRWNDHNLVTLVLEPGDVDLFTSQSFLTGRQFHQCALDIAAEHNSIACVESIFRTCLPSDLEKREPTHGIESAFRIAAKKRHLHILRLILPYITHLSFSKQFLWAARVDGGIAAMEAFYGPDCIQRNRDLPAADTVWRGEIPSVGGEALRLAVRFLSPSNVELLMKRGVRPTGKLSPGSAKTDKEVAALQAIGEFLERRGYALSPHSSIESSGL